MSLLVLHACPYAFVPHRVLLHIYARSHAFFHSLARLRAILRIFHATTTFPSPQIAAACCGAIDVFLHFRVPTHAVTAQHTKLCATAHHHTPPLATTLRAAFSSLCARFSTSPHPHRLLLHELSSKPTTRASKFIQVTLFASACLQVSLHGTTRLQIFRRAGA